MPALIPITEDVGAREEKCTICGEVIGIVDFIVRASAVPNHGIPLSVDYVHLECDPVVKAHVEQLRAARNRIAKQAQAPAPKRFGRFRARF